MSEKKVGPTWHDKDTIVLEGHFNCQSCKFFKIYHVDEFTCEHVDAEDDGALPKADETPGWCPYLPAPGTDEHKIMMEAYRMDEPYKGELRFVHREEVQLVHNAYPPSMHGPETRTSIWVKVLQQYNGEEWVEVPGMVRMQGDD